MSADLDLPLTSQHVSYSWICKLFLLFNEPGVEAMFTEPNSALFYSLLCEPIFSQQCHYWDLFIFSCLGPLKDKYYMASCQGAEGRTKIMGALGQFCQDVHLDKPQQKESRLSLSSHLKNSKRRGCQAFQEQERKRVSSILEIKNKYIKKPTVRRCDTPRFPMVRGYPISYKCDSLLQSNTWKVFP